jgi:2,4-dienoyl-CoA reductase-like NADH-dependent reductase (Old Yellow Enzyme family)
LRELIEDTKEAVGDTCAVAVRFAVDELLGADGMQHDGEARDIVGMLAELPDLWDVNISAGKMIPSPRVLAKKAIRKNIFPSSKNSPPNPSSAWGVTPRPIQWSRPSSAASWI